MAEHYCGHCGIAIPADEVRSGASRGPMGRHLCSHHRDGGTATAVAPAPVSADYTDEAWGAELLFCSNCQVSIPLYDVRSGRARSEYGSILCAVCTRATPGERVARREAVEAEMQADIAADDPVRGAAPEPAPVPTAPRREAAAPPQLQQHMPLDRRPARPMVVPGASGVSVMLVAGIFLLVGIAATALVLQQQEPPPRAVADLSPQLDRLADRMAELERRFDETARSVQNAGRDRDRSLADLRVSIDSLRNGVTGNQDATAAAVRAEVGRSSSDLAQRIARLEGSLEQLAKQVNVFATRPVQAPPAEPPKDPEPPVDTADPGPEKTDPAAPAQPGAEATALIEGLASDETGVRFASASKLGRLGDPAAIPALTRALTEDDNYLVKRACTHALKQLEAWFAVPALIQALEDKEPSVAQAAGQALVEITGTDFGIDWDQSMGERKRRAREARDWWKANQDKPPAGVSLQPVD